MAKGNGIIVSTPPKGTRIGIILNDTSKPGTFLEIDTSKPLGQGGRFYMKASTRANGKNRAPCVLLEDDKQGFLTTTAGVAGTLREVYFPAIGEECNVLVDVPGTGTGSHGGVQFGEYLEYDSAGNLTLESGSPQGTNWQALENIADPGTLTPQLTWCRFFG